MAKIDWMAPLRLRPRERSDDYSSSHCNKGDDYQERFAKLPGRRLAWRFEREFLETTVCGGDRPVSHLDFAGGTGRISSVIAECCVRQTILDISESMLTVASQHVPGARIVCGDFRTNPDIVPAGAFDLVTAFRFFPNAENSLRDAAMGFIARALVPGARLICNNHRNFWSVPYVAGRLLLARAASEGMTNGQLVRLAAGHGLHLVCSRSMGVIPQTDRTALLAWSSVELLEAFFWNHGGRHHRLGYNVVFVFEKSSRS